MFLLQPEQKYWVAFCIADGVCIGANAVVIKDILEPNITVGGIPARKISDNNSDKYIIKATEIAREQ